MAIIKQKQIRRVKKKILLSALCTLCLTGCGDKYKDILADDKVQAKNEEVRMPEREEDTEEARIPGRFLMQL